MSLLTTQEPTLLIRLAERRLTYRWTVRRTDAPPDPGRLVVQLTVRHDRSARRYYAELRNATITDQDHEVMTFAVDDPVWTRQRATARYAKSDLQAFAQDVLAELRADDSDGVDLHVDLATAPATATTGGDSACGAGPVRGPAAGPEGKDERR
jgi:hypothetical protein